MIPTTTLIPRSAVRPEDRAAWDAMKAFDDRIARILAGNGGEVTCPRCNRPAEGWPFKRGDRCSPRDWAKCLRDPETVLADIAARAAKRIARRKAGSS